MLMKRDFSSQIFLKSSDNKFYQISSSKGLVVACGPTYGPADRHDEANRHFRRFANVP
jgi:hypothetical protein